MLKDKTPVKDIAYFGDKMVSYIDQQDEFKKLIRFLLKRMEWILILLVLEGLIGFGDIIIRNNKTDQKQELVAKQQEQQSKNIVSWMKLIQLDREDNQNVRAYQKYRDSAFVLKTALLNKRDSVINIEIDHLGSMLKRYKLIK